MTALGLLMIVLAYLLGSISSAVLICRLYGLPDPREQGSGNPGATNVFRLGGRLAAALVLLCDMLKGTIPVWASYLMGINVHAWPDWYRCLPRTYLPNILSFSWR